ncbi:L-2,4-diaminobutyrate decarboxylase [Streptomyces sp. YIM 130001]|uniref:pyridoxal phosphate-dependent decarboxylase family protein n=1 Tax=Streptomyces sp. YIM 130001 TaxID=2259644 RepID=UPI000E64A857|nr:aminotransferase class V-fold PLP-dependent enzyme [Streptomyces sp. YIM 130001]RII18404.1 L-2,4-diaminobutyrate decarboxylase [Streptomyces sp. YIM 130001]
MRTPPLSGGTAGPTALRPLLHTVLDALHTGATHRAGPLPAGGPEAVTAHVTHTLGNPLPDHGTGAEEALTTLTTLITQGAADPADPHCAAHLHCPPLALATAADLAASALNPSMDSWDQAPAASTLETLITRALAAEIYPPTGTHPQAPADALVTTGGTEANQLALLLAREQLGPVRLLIADNAHHSLHRAAWLLGLPDPITLPAPAGTLDPATLDAALTDLPGPHLVAATAGTTDAGLIDPLPEIADICERHHTRLHIDAAYGAPLLFSPTRRHHLTGLHRAHTVTLDLHKLGWQPVAAGLLAVQNPQDATPLTHSADYLNADDDTDAGLPDLLGRSLRTTRRPDILKTAVTLRALGRTGLGTLVDTVCTLADQLADAVQKHPALELYDRPTISTVLFRPTHTTDTQLADIRRHLLHTGQAVLGRAHLDGRLWLKATLLNPHTTPHHLTTLLTTITSTGNPPHPPVEPPAEGTTAP